MVLAWDVAALDVAVKSVERTRRGGRIMMTDASPVARSVDVMALALDAPFDMAWAHADPRWRDGLIERPSVNTVNGPRDMLGQQRRCPLGWLPR